MPDTIPPPPPPAPEPAGSLSELLKAPDRYALGIVGGGNLATRVAVALAAALLAAVRGAPIPAPTAPEPLPAERTEEADAFTALAEPSREGKLPWGLKLRQDSERNFQRAMQETREKLRNRTPEEIAASLERQRRNRERAMREWREPVAATNGPARPD